MVSSIKVQTAAALTTLAVLLLLVPNALRAQDAAKQPPPSPLSIDSILLPEPSVNSVSIPEDRGTAHLEQTFDRLGTIASVLMIVAHPDDEDGSLLTFLSRARGARCTLLTLTRGEGGQNAMSADTYDALGLIRTNELLNAGEYYGNTQLWGTEVDFGFSKTQEEAFARWGHDRVLYDAVLAVRRVRPQIIVSTFVGGITDGHGHHQVSGEIAQEAFKAAADPNVFPEQLKDGLEPWQASAVYSMVPFAPVTAKGMFDYATGKWAPAKFMNYVTNSISLGVPSTDVSISDGAWDKTLGRSYQQIARDGWGLQKSQNGGGNPTLSGPSETNYHLWGVAPHADARPSGDRSDTAHRDSLAPGSDLFLNRWVTVPTALQDISKLAKPCPRWLEEGMAELGASLRDFIAARKDDDIEVDVAHKLAAIYRQALEMRARVQAASGLDAQSKYDVLFELDLKIEQFQSALKDLLGLDLLAFTTKATDAHENNGFRGASPDETPRSVTPGEDFRVEIHTAKAASDAHLKKTWLVSTTGDSWSPKRAANGAPSDNETSDEIFSLHVPVNAESTQPYFTRPNTEQPFYDLTHPEYRERSFAPWPLAAWAEFSFDGLPIRIGQVVQTMHRVLGPGGVLEPLIVTPAIGVRVEPEARILPLDGSALPVQVTVHAEGAADGTVELTLPAGWTANPPQLRFHLAAAGDTEALHFSVTPASAQVGAYTIQAVVRSGGHTYETGWQSIGYPGLRPYNLYRPARLMTRKVDVKLAPGLRIGYVMGTGDMVPNAIEGLGSTAHLLSADELTSSDLSAFNVIVIGIRAYSSRPELALAQSRLQDFVERGGTLIVQYQSANFPAPYPLSMGRTAERVVDEQAPVKILDPTDSLLTTPNTITSSDFDGWLEERGHSFLDSWDSHYTALTETADPGQDPQRGGLLVAHPGKGTYIYCAYALYRQLPELVPGSYRLLANLLSAAR